MSNYTKTTDFDVKDSLPSGDTGKIIRGSEFEIEFENIEVAIASKADSLNTVLTGTTSVTNLSVTGNTTLGNAASDTVTVNADFSSDLLPSADATYDLGAPGSEWQDLYVTGTANVDSLVADTVAISGGTITATSLTVENNINTDGLIVSTAQGNVTVPATSSSLDFARAGSSYIRATDAAGNFRFITGANDFATSRLAIANNGDISFYEDAGTTAKFFWDSSAESLGIGTTAPSATLHVKDRFAESQLILEDDSTAGLKLIADADGTAGGPVNCRFQLENSGDITVLTDTTERMRIDSTGRVGIGTDTPFNSLHIQDSASQKMLLTNDDFVNGSTGTSFDIAFGATSGNTYTELRHLVNGRSAWGDFVLARGGGNLGVGTTTPSEKLEVRGSVLVKDQSSGASGSVYLGNSNHGIQRGRVGAADINDVEVYTAGAGGIQFLVSGTSPVMRVDDTGRVGIGTVTPSNLLHVAGASAGALELARFRLEGATNNPMLKIEADEANATAGLDTSGSVASDMTFSVAGVERARIDTSGNIGIGTSSPSYTLVVNGGGDNYVSSFESTDTGAYSRWADNATTENTGLGASGNALILVTSGVEQARIASNGNVGIGTSSPVAKGHIAYTLEPTANRAYGLIINANAVGNNGDSASILLNGTNTTARGASIAAEKQSAANDHDLIFSTSAASATPTERMRIDASGNVGIGTSSPSGKLHVQSSASSALINSAADDLIVENSGSGGITVASGADQYGNLFFADSGSDIAGYIQYLHGTDYMRFGTNDTEAMRIDSNGKVGIGVTSNLGGVLTLPHQESISFHDAGGAARRCLEFDSGEVLHGSAGAGITTQTFHTNGAERVRIDGSGNVGIGTTSPASALEVADDSVSTVKIRANALRVGSVNVGNGYMSFGFDNAGGATERLRIDDSGNLLVGTSSVNGNGGLTVSPAASLGSAQISFNRASNASSSSAVVFKSAGSTVGQILYSDTATAYNTSSDVRLKENITDAPEGNIDALQVRSFDWKADGSHQEYGFIAQELEAVAPYAVTRGETEDDMWGVDYSKLVPMLVKEIQDLKARIATLEAN